MHTGDQVRPAPLSEQSYRFALSHFHADGQLDGSLQATIDEHGYCRIVGRIKDLIIRGGENISPREIEDLLFTHDRVTNVAVVGVPDPLYVRALSRARLLTALRSDVCASATCPCLNHPATARPWPPGSSPRRRPARRYAEPAARCQRPCVLTSWSPRSPGGDTAQRPPVDSHDDCTQPAKEGDAASDLARELQQFCRERTAHYKVPRYFIFTDEFPLTVTGKIQKFILRDRAVDVLRLHSVPPAHH